jgi:GT2 family glycosyltransferase
MESNDKIGVVTVTYNSGKVLQDFLRCIFSQTHSNFILFAIDNASTDSTLQLLRDCADPRLVIIANSDNRGVAEGNNQGIRAALEARCGSVLLINNDTVFDKVLIENLASGLFAHGADMTCPKMMYFDEPKRFWAAGGRFRFNYRPIHIGWDELDSGQFEEAKQISYAPTCCVLMKASLFRAIGLMDPKYFVYMDDVDFMFRALRAGARLIYLPNCKLLHKVGSLTGGTESRFQIQYTARNRVYFLMKNFGSVRGLPRLLFDQAYYWARLLTFKDDLKTFKLRQMAFINGMGMTRQR